MCYQVLRYERWSAKGKEKIFSQRYPDHAGGWVWKKHPNQVLFNLPAVLEAPIVFVVEGERDCITLADFGFVGTTNAGGAKAPWLPQFTEVLRSRECILIPDNDVPGRARVARIARALIGKVSKLVILTLDDGSKDITEWFERGHSELELIAQVEGEEVSR
jgi:putative DNA primase/helicase